MSNQYQNPNLKLPFYKKILVAYLLLNILVVIFIAGYGAGFLKQNLGQSSQAADGQVLNKEEVPEYLKKDVNFEQFWQVWEYIKENYVKSDISESQLFYGALAGLVASLRDPYSVFLDPDFSKEFSQELAGSFEGIGAEIGLKEGRLTVIAPLPGTPADEAGLKAGDKILAIDDKDTTGMALDYAVSIIRGKKGTEVKLTVITTGDDEPRELKIIRDKIEIDSVRFNRKDTTGKNEGEEGFSMKEDNIAYVELLYFNENTLGDWNQTVQKILTMNPKGMILDLRNNPGGFLQVAIEVAGEWVDGKTVVAERLRSGAKLEHKAERQARFASIPTVVLVNNGSASGSEIVAGALQDYKAATIVGETTFGKGSVQDLKEFPDGSSVKLTIAEWLTPNGRNINEQGIKPDFEVELTREDYDAGKDPQLDKALEILKNQK
ncbi:MAG TPA: S41 family peptidase [Patescibacteria group bacterium]|nr:S41 family peptidase [Patescibacteria group bacterium]